MAEITCDRPARSGGVVPDKPQRPAWTRGRRVLALAGAGVVAAGALTATSMVTGPDGHPATALALDHLPGDRIAIRVVDTQASAQEMTRELRAAGLHLRVSTEAATPQLVGRWIAASGYTSDDPVERKAELEITSQMGSGSGSTATIVVTWPGPSHEVGLWVGRAPRGGEAIQASGGTVNAASPGGLVYCEQLSGTDPALAEQRLHAHGYGVIWRDDRQQSTHTQRVAVLTSTSPPAGLVTRVVIPEIDPQGKPGDVAEVYVAPADDPGYTARVWDGYGLTARITGHRDYITCPAQP